MDPTLEKLYRQPLLDPLPEEVLDEVREVVNVRVYRPEEIVFRQGDPAQHFYMISDGQFEVVWEDEAGESHRINLLYPGEFFGDVSLIDGEPRGVTIRATTEGEVLFIEREAFFALLRQFPVLEQGLAQQGQTIEARSMMRFDGQADDEIVLYFDRRHWIALLRRSGKIVVMLLVLLAALAVGAAVFSTNVAAQSVFAVVWLLALLVPLAWGVWEFIDWYNDHYIVTDQRVIQVERVIGLVSRRYEAPLSKIQNVTVAHATPLGEILGYGKVIIATGAQGEGVGALVLDYMPGAEVIAERIIAELNKERNQVSHQEQEEKRRALRAALGLEPHTEPVAAEPIPPAPPAPEAPPGLGRVFNRLLHFLQPIMREQIGGRIIWRKHWLILLKESTPAYVLLFAILSATLVAEFNLDLTGQAAYMLWLLAGMLFVFNVGWLLWHYIDWRNDVYMLTPDAILDEEKRPFGFNQTTRRAPLDTIQDIRYVQNNPLMVMFGVGNVHIQTAGQQGMFTFDWVQDPRAVQTDIFDYIRAQKRQRQRNEAAAINSELVELLKMYEEEKGRANRAPRRPAPRFTPDPSDPDATKPSSSV
ncbi:MAG TPA: cyclic nucleotide-binding domain-containing protein [Ardenticatenaceae bacterium]|jgi:CRP-like cAMP-binding protein